MDAVTVALSKELGPKKIRVNSLNPGMVETEALHAAGIAESDFRKTVETQTPLGRIGRPEDIARVAQEREQELRPLLATRAGREELQELASRAITQRVGG